MRRRVGQSKIAAPRPEAAVSLDRQGVLLAGRNDSSIGVAADPLRAKCLRGYAATLIGGVTRLRFGSRAGAEVDIFEALND